MSRSFRRRPHGSLLLLGGAALVLAARLAYDRAAGDAAGTSPPLIAGPCRIVRAIDGYTLLVEQESPAAAGQRVRLLGVVPVESPAWRAAAERLTRQLVAGGQARLDLDKRRVDREGELLAYVYVEGRSLGEALVRAGLAVAENYPGDNQAISRQMFRAESAARRERLGMWSE
jgi:micrococcal nuclease